MGVVIIDVGSAHSGFAVGAAARGEFQCADCGYGVVVHRALPACPMCQGGDWRPWSGGRPANSQPSATGPLRV
jgi:hypothetical protein